MSDIPVLDELETRLDWPRASFRTAVTIGPGEASVECRLDQASVLQKAVEAGDATWAAEVRAPKALYSRLSTSPTPSFSVRWDEQDVTRELFITAGIVAVNDFRLPTSELLKGIWREPDVQVSPGSWLALGKRRARESVSASLLTLRLDPLLADGQMRVVASDRDGALSFTAYLSADLYKRRRTSRDVQIAALIAACAQLPEHLGDSEETAPAVLLAVKRLLQDAGVPTWEDEDDWNPALAATALEPFRAEEDEDDDE